MDLFIGFVRLLIFVLFLFFVLFCLGFVFVFIKEKQNIFSLKMNEMLFMHNEKLEWKISISYALFNICFNFSDNKIIK